MTRCNLPWDITPWCNKCSWCFASIALEPATVPPESLVPTIGNSASSLSVSSRFLLMVSNPGMTEVLSPITPPTMLSFIPRVGGKSLEAGGFFRYNLLHWCWEVLCSWAQLPCSLLTLCPSVTCPDAQRDICASSQMSVVILD